MATKTEIKTRLSELQLEEKLLRDELDTIEMRERDNKLASKSDKLNMWDVIMVVDSDGDATEGIIVSTEMIATLMNMFWGYNGQRVSFKENGIHAPLKQAVSYLKDALTDNAYKEVHLAKQISLCDEKLNAYYEEHRKNAN